MAPHWKFSWLLWQSTDQVTIYQIDDADSFMLGPTARTHDFLGKTLSTLMF